MASSTSASSSQSLNASANTSTVAGSATTTITVGNFFGLQSWGNINIGGAGYDIAGPTSMNQGNSWSYSASRLFGHDSSGFRGDVGVSASFRVDGTTLHRSSATAATQGAINYDRSANTPYFDNITRTSPTNIFVTFARTGSVNGPTTYVLERATNAAMTENYTTFSEGNQTVVSTTNYFFRMYAFGDEGGARYSGVYGPYNGVPTAPTSVVGTASSSVSGRINVSWTAPSATNGGITNYQIFRGGTFIGQTGNATTSFIDNGLTKGTSYTYTVVAVNATGSSVASSASTATQAPGTPYAPTLDTVTASTNTFGRVSLAWTAPSTAVGTMQNYLMYAVFDGNIERTVSTGTNVTSGEITGLDERKVYTFYVRGRNQFSIDNGTPGDQSNTINRKSPGPPSAPTNLTANAPFFPPGTVDLSWTAPSDVGTEGGTITGYSVYLAGQSVPIKTTTGTGTTTTITDLIPATAYTFNVRARNAIADTVGTFSVASNSVTATAQGEPDAPTNFTVVPDPVVSGRLVLTWTPPAGYNTGFRVYTGADVLVANIAVPRLEIDGLTPNISFSYKVRARNPLTDLTGAEGGAFSTTVSGVVGASSTQTVPSTSVTNSTNSTFVGTYNLISTTSTTMTYSKTASNIPFASVPVSGGSTANNTNTNLNGTYTVTAVGTQATSTAVTYAKAGSDIPANTSTPSGTMYNNTNVIFNGNYEVLGSPAPDPVLKTVSYTKVSSDITPRVASGTITNNSNATYNGEYVISEVTETSIIFPKTSDDIEESDAFGVVFNKTNHDIFNGTFILTDTPDHKTVEYSTGDLTYGENLITNPSFETVQSGTTVLRTNLIANPSFDTNVTGWTASNASIARRSDVSKFGTHSALISPSSNTGSVSYALSIASAGDYMFSAWVYTPEDKNIQIVSGSTFAVPADTWTRISSVVSLPSGSTSVGISSVDSAIPFYVDGAFLEAGTTLKPYFDGASTDELGWNYEWTGTANASTSTAKALNTRRTNLMPNPNFESGLTGWAVVGDTPSLSTSIFYQGSQSMQVPSGGTKLAIYDNIFVDESSTYTVSAWVYGLSTQTYSFWFRCYNSSNAVIDDYGFEMSTSVTAETWTRLSNTITVPAGTVKIRAVFQNQSDGFYIDNVLIEKSNTLGSYFDGSTVGASWSGTANLSTSNLGENAPAPVGLAGASATVTSSYDQIRSGVLSALVTPSSNTGGATLTMTTVASRVYTFSAWIYAASAKNIQLSADSTVGSVIAIPATTWTRAVLSFTASDTSTLISILGTDSTTAFYVDDIMLQESATAQAYFDGDTDDATDTWPVVYTWGGTPHASISIREVGGTLPSVGADILSPFGEASRVDSEAQLQIRYRSGWIG